MTQLQGPYHHSPEAVDVTQCQGDVDEHNGIADYYGADVTVALPVYLIFDTPLGVEGYGEVGVFVVLHELDESETRTNTHKKIQLVQTETQITVS